MQALGTDVAEARLMLRSLLFAPGDSDKKMAKAAGIGADCVILDLEDSVAAARKPIARGMTRDYLKHLRKTMGEAVSEFVPFDEAYEKTDWSAFSSVPMFGPANRMNAYNTYLLLEQEAFQKR